MEMQREGEDDSVPTLRALVPGHSGIDLARKPLVPFGDTFVLSLHFRQWVHFSGPLSFHLEMGTRLKHPSYGIWERMLSAVPVLVGSASQR